MVKSAIVVALKAVSEEQKRKELAKEKAELQREKRKAEKEVEQFLQKQQSEIKKRKILGKAKRGLLKEEAKEKRRISQKRQKKEKDIERQIERFKKGAKKLITERPIKAPRKVLPQADFRKIMRPVEDTKTTILEDPFIFGNKQPNQQKRMRWFS